MTAKSAKLNTALILGLFAATAPTYSQEHECSSIESGRGYDLRVCEEKLKILKLSGSPVERARTLGGLLRQGKVSWATYDYFSGKVAKMLEPSPAVVRTLANAVYANYASRSYNRLPQSYKDEVVALSAASGKDLGYFKKAFALPDFGTSIQGFGDYLAALNKSLGCTSVGLIESDGHMQLARNLDFSGVGVWDRLPMIVVNIPEEGSTEIAHISFGAEGMHYGSISGVNQAGIGIVVHLNLMKDSLQKMNQTMYVVGEEVLRRAHSMSEAIDVLRTFRTGPQWAYVVSDFNSGKIVTVEVSKDRFYVRAMQDGVFGQSNHVANPDAAKAQAAPYGFLKNSIFRKQFIESRARELQNQPHTMSDVLDIIGYGRDPDGQLSAHSDVVKAHTIQSVAFEGTEGQGLQSVWIGFDSAPTSTGRFGGFSPDDLYSLNPVQKLSMKVITPSSMNEERRKNQMDVSAAYELITEQRKPMEALKSVEGQHTTESFLLRATLLYRAKRYGDAMSELARVPSEAVDYEKYTYSKHLEESVDYLQALAAIQLKQTRTARDIASERTAKGVESPFYQKRFKEILKLKDGKTLSQMKVNYDFFAGDIEP